MCFLFDINIKLSLLSVLHACAEPMGYRQRLFKRVLGLQEVMRSACALGSHETEKQNLEWQSSPPRLNTQRRPRQRRHQRIREGEKKKPEGERRHAAHTL